MYPLLRLVMRALAAVILGRHLHVIGVTKVPRRGGVLVISNHIATVDPPLTGALIHRRDVHYMAKAESFRSLRTRWLFYAYNAFPVVRGSADRTALKRAIAILKAGHVLLVYPEGTRSPDASLRRPHAGIGFLARHTGALIVPAAISGSEHVLPKGASWPRRHDVTIRFGDPFTAADLAGDGRLSNQETADEMMWRVAALLPAAYRGVFTSREAVAAATPPPAA